MFTCYTILQYLQDSSQNDDNNKNYKNYLHRGSCTPCWMMTHKENLEQSQLTTGGVWLGEAIASNNIYITKIYRERQKDSMN